MQWPSTFLYNLFIRLSLCNYLSHLLDYDDQPYYTNICIYRFFDYELMWTIVFFKRLDSRGFHDLFHQYTFSHRKRYEYLKTEAYEMCFNF